MTFHEISQKLPFQGNSLKLQLADYQLAAIFFCHICTTFSNRQIEREKSFVRGHNDVIAKIERFFPDTIAMIPALEECEQVGIPDSFARKLMDGGVRSLTKNVSLDYTDKNEKIEVVAGTTFKFIRDPSDNKFHLHINGTRIFQWLKEQWQSLKQTVKRGFGSR